MTQTRCRSRCISGLCFKQPILCAGTEPRSLVITVSWSVGQTHLCWSGGGSHPAPSLHRQILILSIRGILFRLTPSRINSFPNGFYFICSLIINFINGQAGNATLLFLFFLQYFSDVHFSYFHVDVFHVENSKTVLTCRKLTPGVCASRAELLASQQFQHRTEPLMSKACLCPLLLLTERVTHSWPASEALNWKNPHYLLLTLALNINV